MHLHAHAVPADLDVVVRGDAFPAAGGVRRARLEELRLHRIRRKVIVTLHALAAIALRDDLPVPHRLRHGRSSKIAPDFMLSARG
ncbi:hypothetical protein D3C83_92500 [compost metagenome]